MTKVGDVVSLGVICLQREDSLARAFQIMVMCDIRHIPVVRNEKYLAGVVSLTDLLLYSRYDNGLISFPKKMSLADCMSSHVITCSLDSELVWVAQVMSTNKLRCLPVVDQQQLIAIVTTSDLVDYISSRGNHYKEVKLLNLAGSHGLFDSISVDLTDLTSAS